MAVNFKEIKAVVVLGYIGLLGRRISTSVTTRLPVLSSTVTERQIFEFWSEVDCGKIIDCRPLEGVHEALSVPTCYRAKEGLVSYALRMGE